MRKWIGFIIAIASVCALAGAALLVLRSCNGCPGKRFKALFTEKDFTVLPLEKRDED